MKQRDVRVYLFDAREACDLVLQFTAGKELVDYIQDAMLRSAVERQLEIVGEALNRALQNDQSLSDKLPEIRKIVAFRNRLVHGYFSLSNHLVWRIVEAEVPPLRRALGLLLPTEEAPKDLGQ